MLIISNVKVYLKSISHRHMSGRKGIGSDFQIRTEIGITEPSILNIKIPKDTTKSDIDFVVYQNNHSWETEEILSLISLPLQVTITEQDDKVSDVSSAQKQWQIELSNFPTPNITYEPQQEQITIQISELAFLNPLEQFIQNLGFGSPTPTAAITIIYQVFITLVDSIEIMALALAIWTEARDNSTDTIRREEMIRVGGAILNRTTTNYRDQSTVLGAVLDPFQYSHFNDSTNPERVALESEDVQRVLNLMGNSDRWDEALEIARGLASGTIANPWSDNTVRHYYSPRSMDPPGSAPDWVIPSQEVDVPKIPDERFRWYRGIL